MITWRQTLTRWLRKPKAPKAESYESYFYRRWSRDTDSPPQPAGDVCFHEWGDGGARTICPKCGTTRSAAMRIVLTAAVVAISLTTSAYASFPGQEACCGPSSMYNEQNSTPLQFQEDNSTGQACCGLGSQFEMERERQQEQMQQFMEEHDGYSRP